MKRFIAMTVSLVLLLSLAVSCAEPVQAAAENRTTVITAHFASLEEGQALMRGKTLYYEQVNEKDLAFLMQKKDGTIGELIDYEAEQVMAFTAEDEQRISDGLAWLQQQLESHGLKLPDPGTVTFVKTTGKEATGAGGYTSEGNVFLTSVLFERADDDLFRDILIHEISHCLSRLFPEYRAALYDLIHFRVLDADIDIPQEIRDQFIANPDVEHHNSVAAFTVNGEKKECYLVFMTDDVFENPGDNFFRHKYTGVVPLGESVVYRAEDVTDFWDVVGSNTDYAEDPEEIMATNFALAIMNLDKGYESFKSPEILEGIIDYLKTE